MDKPHIVIVGGGFGGLNAAKEFEFTNVRVTLLDRQNHHTFQPLLYQVATAALSAPDVATPIRKIFKDYDNTTVLMDEVVNFDLDRKVVYTASAELPYDYLIVAAGTKTRYFNPEWEDRAPGLKSVADALEIRREVLLAYESAEREQHPELRQQWLTFVVIGAGPTGVEMAGALSEIAQRTMARNFRTFDPSQVKVYLVEGLDEVLPNFPSEKLRKKALQQLEALGVEVRLETFVESIEEDGIVTRDGERIAARTVIWAAGMTAEPIADRLGAEQDKMGRVKVKTDLTLPGHPEVFVVGDLAACTDADGVEVPQLAPAAIQMGRHAATNIKRSIGGREPLDYTYLDKGQMATIGRSKAIAKSGSLEMSGLIAWFAWLFIHLMYLVEFRNRISVLLEWAYAYLTFQRSARVVIQSPRRLSHPIESFQTEDASPPVPRTPEAETSEIEGSEAAQ